jgi:hypothetical protein
VSHTAPFTEQDTATGLDDRVLCARCRSEITRTSLAVRRSGSHQHTFRNPAGYSWTIACYRDASGCASEGGFTDEATWFAGYEWCFAPCATCGRHLGWWFTGDGPSFVGLIVSRMSQ